MNLEKLENERYDWTDVQESKSVKVIAELVAAMFPTLRFYERCDLQCLEARVWRDARVHIWHRDIHEALGGFATMLPHNHRYQLYSIVLAGGLKNHAMLLRRDPSGYWRKRVTQSEIRQTPTMPSEERYTANVSQTIIKQGEEYSAPSDQFHTTYCPDQAVTVTWRKPEAFESEVLVPHDAGDEALRIHQPHTLAAVLNLQTYISAAFLAVRAFATC